MAAGKEIKRLRGKDVTASKAAKFIGVGVDRLRKWEERDSDPADTGDRAKVEAYFGVKLDQLHTLKSFDFVEFTQQNEGPKAPGYVPAQELIAVLKEQNEFLRRNFELSLNSIVEGQQQSGVQLKALTWYSALVANNGDQKLADRAMLEINNKMAFYAGVGGEGGNHDKQDNGGTSNKRKSA